MPFGHIGTEEHNRNLKIYQQLIKPIVQECGYESIRADELEHFGNITRDIIELLYESDLVIADLSGKNANVFYELGVRHALLRYGTVPIIRKGETLPFDIANYRAVFYSTELDGPEEFRNELRRRIKAFEFNTKKKSDNPVHDIIGDRLITLSFEESVPLEEYEQRVYEISRLNRQITDLRNQLISNENSHNEKIGVLNRELIKEKILRLEMEKSEEQVKQMLISILAKQINIARQNILNRLFYCLNPTVWLKKVT